MYNFIKSKKEYIYNKHIPHVTCLYKICEKWGKRRQDGDDDWRWRWQWILESGGEKAETTYSSKEKTGYSIREWQE